MIFQNAKQISCMSTLSLKSFLLNPVSFFSHKILPTFCKCLYITKFVKKLFNQSLFLMWYYYIAKQIFFLANHELDIYQSTLGLYLCMHIKTKTIQHSLHKGGWLTIYLGVNSWVSRIYRDPPPGLSTEPNGGIWFDLTNSQAFFAILNK